MKKLAHRDGIHEEDGQELPTHRMALGKSSSISISNLSLGDVVHFYYDGSDRYVYVLAVWEEKIHGLSLRHIDHHTLLTEVVVYATKQGDPKGFYQSHITKPAIASKNCYRTYNISKVSRLTKIEYKVPK